MKSIPILIFIILVLIFTSAYTIDERQKGILFQLGKIVDTELDPGLHFKIPFFNNCLLYTSPSPRDRQKSRMPSSA